MKHAIRTATAFALATLCFCSGAGAKLVTFQIPDAAGITFTGMNDKGQVTGWYIDRQTTAFHGFVVQRDGALTTFDVPAPLWTKSQQQVPEATITSGISEDGVIAGAYGSNYRGGSFVRAANGAITTFSVGRNTIAAAISPTGWVVGRYSLEGKHQNRPFLRDPAGATHDFSVPGAHGRAYPMVVNRSRAIAGVAGPAHPDSSSFQAFFRPAHGKAVLFGDSHAAGMAVTGINDAGTVVGWFVNVVDKQQSIAFLRTSDGTLTNFTGPGGPIDTKAYAINKAGTIAGTFVDSNGARHGFLRTADGTFTPFDVKGGTGTAIYAINAKGSIAGMFGTQDGDFGFVGKP